MFVLLKIISLIKDPFLYASSGSLFSPDEDAASTSSSIDIVELGSLKPLNRSENRITERIPSTADESQEYIQKGLEKQVCRIEAKLNQMQSVMLQIQRMVISSSVADTPRPEEFPELPLLTEDAINKFESDLNEKSYKKNIVSSIRLTLSISM